MTENKIIESIEQMDVFEKQKFYIIYYVNTIARKLSSQFIDLKNPYLKVFSLYNGMGKPDIEFQGVALYYLWKDTRIRSFEQFCNPNNVKLNYIKYDNWKGRGFASKKWQVIHPESIYHYVINKIK